MAKFKVKRADIGRTVLETRVEKQAVELHPKGAPNVVYILMDDMGFAQLGCYGSNIRTPNIDRLANEGLRYNNFHTTAICSATRASLLTGANHHACGVGSLVEFITGCPNAQGHIDNSYATIAEILKEYDYATYCSGKWHLSMGKAPAGPYDQWPLGKGFDRYYGFLHGEIDQYHPHLIRDNSEVEQPKTPEEGYHLSADIVDNAIDMVFQHTMAYPEQPFFLYLPFGAMHTPHHAPKEYIDRYKGEFDEGWDVIRQKWFENQKKIGIIPKDAELTPRNEYVPAWDSLSPERKKVYARYMEAFAGFLEYTDEQIGRLIDYLEESGQLDNTVVVFLSDNGASGEGGVQGRFNAMCGQDITVANEEELPNALEHFDEIGGEYSFNHYPTGWANAGNTPFQWYKVWTHEGGVRDPLIIRYPKLIKDNGGIRSQYHHVSDITPTILDIIGVEKPAVIKGVPQKPFTGISMKYTFESAEVPDERRVQYYELHGNRGIYKDGWKAVTNHMFSESYNDDVWELYHVSEDFSEAHNVADKYPEKLRELQEEFFIEAGRNNVFPMLRASFHAKPENIKRMYGNRRVMPETERVFRNVIKPYDLVPQQMSANVDSASHYVEAEIHRSDSSEEGVIFSSGDRFGGFVFYIKDNKLKYAYNFNRYDFYTAESDIEVPLGASTVKYTFTVREDSSADVELYINGAVAGGVHVKHFYYMKGFATTLKANKHTAVYDDYEVPFEFGGRLRKLVIHQYAAEYVYLDELKKASNIE
ncbi:MAG: arylsulfatase [Ruminiclostridium sp.]